MTERKFGNIYSSEGNQLDNNIDQLKTKLKCEIHGNHNKVLQVGYG